MTIRRLPGVKKVESVDPADCSECGDKFSPGVRLHVLMWYGEVKQKELCEDCIPEEHKQ